MRVSELFSMFWVSNYRNKKQQKKGIQVQQKLSFTNAHRILPSAGHGKSVLL